jgi:hypothetical protein
MSGERVAVLEDTLEVRVDAVTVKVWEPRGFATAQVVAESRGIRMNLLGFGSDELSAALRREAVVRRRLPRPARLDLLRVVDCPAGTGYEHKTCFDAPSRWQRSPLASDAL